MKRSPKKPLTADRLAARVVTVCLTVMAAGMYALYFLSGYEGLLLLSLIFGLPALVHLVLLLPFGKAPAPIAPAPVAEESPVEGEASAKKHHKHHFPISRAKLSASYRKARAGIVTAVIAAALVAAHLVFWKFPTEAGQIPWGYVSPVVLTVLFVISIVLEKWCSFAIGENRYTKAMLRGLQSSLELGRVALLLTAVTMMLQLLGLYDAQSILRILLAVLFVYESVFVAFSLAVRVIRHELSTAPEFLISVPGLSKSDTSILRYLESNTGITMRSLWSMQLVKKLIPGIIMGIVLVIWLSTGVVQIQSHQQGALYRLGELQPELLEPGLHMTLPWPFDSVDVYDTETLNRVTIGYIPSGDQDNTWTENHGTEEHRLLLGDGNELISINLQVEYRIGDLHRYIRSAASPESLLEAAGYEIVTERTISTDLDTMLAADRQAFSESFKADLAEKIADYDTGLVIESVVLESIHPPVEVADIFQRLVSASIDAEHMILTAINDANTAKHEALCQQIVAIGDAKVQHHTEVGNAESAVAEFMASVEAYNTHPSAYRYYKYMTAMTQAYANSKLVIVSEGVNTQNIWLGNVEPAETEPQDYDFETDEFYDDEDYAFDGEY